MILYNSLLNDKILTNVTRDAIGSLKCFNSTFDVKQLIEDSEYGVS